MTEETPYINGILDDIVKKGNNENSYSIYIDDRYYYQLLCERNRAGGISTSVNNFNPDDKKIMGHTIYRVSPNDNHPDFKIVVDEKL